MYNPTICLIIPTYNRSKWLKRAIDSIYFVEFDEVIVVNDGSDKNHTTDIEKILDNYPKIKYIKHDSNKGLGEARNTGIKKCTSEWVTFLDDDDYYIKNPLENLKNHIIKHPEADVINYKITLKKGEKTVDWGHAAFTLEDLVNYNRLTGSSLLKKSVWAKLKGYKNIPYEDWEFWVRVKQAKFNFVFFNDIFYVRDMISDGLEKNTGKTLSDIDWKIKYIGIDLIKQSRNKDIGLGISTFLRDDSLFRLVDSILTHLQEFKMYIVDQGEHSEVKDKLYTKLSKLGHVIKYIPYDSGISKTRRILKEICKEEFLVYMEDDFQATTKTNLYNLKEILDENPELGIVGGNLEGYATTGAYSYFLNRADNQICYFPMDYLIEKNLVAWEYTNKGIKFLRADIVSDFTMWRREVPNIFDDNVKVIEHSHVYLLVKNKTKYKVCFCPGSEIKHVHDNKNPTYNALRTRKKDLDYLKSYWNVFDFYTFNKSSLCQLEKASKNIAPVAYLPLESTTDIPEIKIQKLETIESDKVNKLNIEQKQCIVKIINYLNDNSISFWLLNYSCLEAVTKKDIVSDKLYIGVATANNKELILNAFPCEGGLLDIKIEGKRKTKPAKLYDLNINVPVPVVAYLEKTFKQTWDELKNG